MDSSSGDLAIGIEILTTFEAMVEIECNSSLLNGQVRHHLLILLNICLKKNDATKLNY